MEFEWDANKRLNNIKKHGVDFTEAVQVFRDPLRLEALDGPAGAFGQEPTVSPVSLALWAF